jgi:hypothetical protein
MTTKLAHAFMVGAAMLAIPAATFAQPHATKCNSIETRQVKLDAKNDEWVSADLKLKPNDLVIIFVKGEAVVGKRVGSVNAAGSPGDGYGKVEMKVGTGTVIPTGAKYVGGVSDGGTVKFRVWDTQYQDNSGGFEAFIIVIPPGVIPEPKLVQAD